MGKLSIIKKGVGICLYLIELASDCTIHFPYDKMDVVNDNRSNDRYLFPDYWQYDKDIDFIARKHVQEMRWHRGHYSSDELLKDMIKTTI